MSVSLNKEPSMIIEPSRLASTSYPSISNVPFSVRVIFACLRESVPSQRVTLFSLLPAMCPFLLLKIPPHQDRRQFHLTGVDRDYPSQKRINFSSHFYSPFSLNWV